MLRRNRLCRIVSLLLITSFALYGCATTKTGVMVREHERYGLQVYKRSFDDYGRPVFLMLTTRPTRVGETFSLVEFSDNLPSISYEISIRDEPSTDYRGPVARFFENIAGSLVAGLIIGWTFLEIADDSENLDEGEAFAAGFILGTGGGLLYSGFTFGSEASRLVVNRTERVVSETHYGYDEQGRLKSILTMPPLGNQWESRTTNFIYDNGGTVPSRTENLHNGNPDSPSPSP